MNRICWLIALLLVSLSAHAQTANQSHYQAARAFYRVAKVDDPKAVSAVVSNMLTELQPGLARHQDIITEFTEDLLRSPRYENAQLRVYMELFSEAQLRRLTDLFLDPTFQQYRRLRVRLVQRNAEETFAVFRQSLPELERRVRASQAPARDN